MNRSEERATADITVFDVIKRFRLVVMEVRYAHAVAHWRGTRSVTCSRGCFMLSYVCVGEAGRACRHGLEDAEVRSAAGGGGNRRSASQRISIGTLPERVRSQRARDWLSLGPNFSSGATFCLMAQESKRRRATSEGGAAIGSVSAAGPELYMLRVVGPVFSFYSVAPSLDFLRVFEDYRELPSGADPPLMPVYKCSFVFPAAPELAAAAAASAEDRTLTEFNFQLPAHRELIVHMLDSIRTRIVS